MKLFKHGETVRFVDFGTPSQREALWVVTFENMDKMDWGDQSVRVHRQTDPDNIIWLPRAHVEAATVLDLLANI